MTQPVTVRSLKSAKCWSEWQDLNLRPPRPERVRLRKNARYSTILGDFVEGLCAFVHGVSFAIIRHGLERERRHRGPLVVRAVVSVDPIEHISGDTKEGGSIIPGSGTAAGNPGARRMAQRMGDDIGVQPGKRSGGAERLVDPLNRLSIPFDDG